MLETAISPAPRGEWEEIACADPDALVEHTPLWLDAMGAAGRCRDESRLYRFRDGRRFVLPLARFWPHPAPRSGFSTGWGIGGTVGCDLDAHAVSSIIKDLAADKSLYTHVRPNPLHASLWDAADTGPAQTISRRAHVVNLTGGSEAVFDRFRKSGRRGIKKAERAEVEVTRHIGGDQLEVYYTQLFLPSVQRWAKRQHEPGAIARIRAVRRDPLSRLHAIAQTLGPAFHLYLARVGGRPVAGAIVLSGARNAHTTRGAMDASVAAKSNAAYALDWAALQDACEVGATTYHMGETGQNDSLADYKERFGAEAINYNEYRIERLPLLAADRALRTCAKRLIGFRDIG